MISVGYAKLVIHPSISFCFDRVGIDLPTIEVRYENLSVEAEAYVGNRGLPTILNSALNVLEARTLIYPVVSTVVYS